MKIPLFSTTKDFDIENFSPPAHIEGNLKEYIFMDGSTEVKRFGAKSPVVEITFVKLLLNELTDLKNFFIQNSYRVEVQQSELFGYNPKNVKSWICSASVLDVAGASVYSKSGLTNSMTVQFSLDSVVDNNNVETSVKDSFDDFYIKIFPNAVVCDIFKALVDISSLSGFIFGYSNIPASLVPEANEGDRVFILKHQTTQVEKKAYLYKRVGNQLTLINHLTYNEVDFIALESFDIAKEGDSALLSNGIYCKVEKNISTNLNEWNVKPLPPISQFKKVIVSSSSPYIQRGSDCMEFFYFKDQLLADGGLSLPQRSINIEDGGAVEYPQGFSLTFNNAKRAHWTSLNSGFNGATCEVYNAQGNTIYLIQKGVCTGSNEDFSGYTLSFDPLSLNLYEKNLLQYSRRSVYGSWGYISAKIEEKEDLFSLYEVTSGIYNTNTKFIFLNHTMPSGQERKFFVQFGSDERKMMVTRSGSNNFGTWITLASDFEDSSGTSQPIFIYKFSAEFLISENLTQNSIDSRPIRAYVKNDSDNLIPILNSAFTYSKVNGQNIGRIEFENTREKDIEFTKDGKISSFDSINLFSPIRDWDSPSSPYYMSVPNIPNHTQIGYGFFQDNFVLNKGFVFTTSYEERIYSASSINKTRRVDRNFYVKSSLNSGGRYPRVTTFWNTFKFLHLYESSNVKIKKGDALGINYKIPQYFGNNGSDKQFKADIYGLTKTNPQWVLLAIDWEFCEKTFDTSMEDVKEIKLDLSNSLCFDLNDDWNFSHIGIFQKASTIDASNIKTSNLLGMYFYMIDFLNPSLTNVLETRILDQNRANAYVKNGGSISYQQTAFTFPDYLTISTKNEFDLGDTIYIDNFQGRTDSLSSNFPNTYNGIYDSMTRTSGIPITLAKMPNTMYYDKLRMIIEDEYTFKELIESIALHSFCGLRLDASGNYIPFNLDVKNINPVFEFNESNILDGSFESVKFRDSVNIANGINVDFHFSAISENLTRKLKAYIKSDVIKIEGLGTIDKDRYELGASDTAKTGFLGDLSQLKTDMDFSKTFYGVVSQTDRSYELPWFYDSSFMESSDPLKAPVRWIEKVARWFLFNSWSFNISVKADLFLGATPLNLGDYVSVKTYFHSDSYDVLGVIDGLEIDAKQGIANLSIYTPIPPEVSASLYDNIWNGGIIDENYDVNNYKHRALIKKYPFKNDPEGQFSSGGIIDSNYDASQLQFIDGSFANPSEEISPLP